MTDLPVFVFSNIRHHWLLPGCLFLLDKYWPGRYVQVVSYGRRPKQVDDKYGYRKIAKSNYPPEKWSDGVMEFLERIDDRFFIMLLEDYWLSQPVKTSIVSALEDYMRNWSDKDNILRIDLSGDRASGKRSVFYMELQTEYGQKFDLIKSKPTADYQMSFQAAIWNKRLLLEFMKRGESAWAVETFGTERLHKRPEIVVLGTNEMPLNYKPVFRVKGNKFDYSHLSAITVGEMRKQKLLNHV